MLIARYSSLKNLFKITERICNSSLIVTHNNCISALAYRNCISINKRLITEAACNAKTNNWRELCSSLLDKINKDGIQSLDDKFIPVKARRHRASGETSDHFMDFCEIRVVGGNGGDGSFTFAQLFANEHAGPDGGNGGHGGHVIMKATRGKKSLNHLPKLIMAKSGENGRSKGCDGKSAENIILEVPVGTVFRLKNQVVADLEEGDVFIAARGGAGGKGNTFFATSLEQTPKFAECGGRGEVFNYEVELKVMADIGLIGFPNAGKSTLLRSISRARPKVAAYPFTTLNPHVGMVSFADHHQMAVADIPGLIEGSHTNLGLGMAFLKHVQRCSCLLYVLDAADEDPSKQLQVLKNELDQYQEEMSLRPHAIVLNKMDLPHSQKNYLKLQEATNLPIITISAKMSQNIEPLLAVMRLLTESQTSS